MVTSPSISLPVQAASKTDVGAGPSAAGAETPAPAAPSGATPAPAAAAGASGMELDDDALLQQALAMSMQVRVGSSIHPGFSVTEACFFMIEACFSVVDACFFSNISLHLCCSCALLPRPPACPATLEGLAAEAPCQWVGVLCWASYRRGPVVTSRHLAGICAVFTLTWAHFCILSLMRAAV